MSEWRDLAIADAINKAHETQGRPDTAKLIHVSGFQQYLNPVIQDLVGPADIITVQRNVVNATVLDSIRYWMGMGKPIAVDLDDGYNILPWSNPAHQYWIVDESHTQPLVYLEKGLQLCGYLTSPNQYILNDWQHVAKGFLLPNYARREWWENLRSRAEMKTALGLQDRIVIGWGGSVSHYDSWWGSQIREAAQEIYRIHPEVVWLICGNDPRIYEQLPVPSSNKQQQPGVPAAQWPQIIKTFDIGVAPLFGPYDQRRSWIKTLEYGLAGVPWVATEGEPYHEHRLLGRTLVNSVGNWFANLDYIIKHLTAEQAIAEQRIPLYQQWFVDQQLDTYINVYKRIIQEHRLDHGQLPNIYYLNWSES